MADAPGTPAPWLDLLDEDIPVVDKSGKQLLVKGLDFVERNIAKPAAASAPTAPSIPPPPPNLPMGEPVHVPQSPALEAQPTATRGDFGLDTAKDAADLKKIEVIVAGRSVVAETKAEASLLDTMVEQAVSGTGVNLPDEDVRRRYRMLVSLFFRDLRDGLETRSKFTMPVQSGGMGMTDADAERVMADLGKRNDDYHAALTGKAVDDKAKYVAVQTQKVLGGQDEMEKKDQERREEAFTGLLQRTGVQGAAPASSPTPPPREPKVIPVVGLDAQGKATPAAPATAQPAPAAPIPVQAAAPPASAAPAPSGAQPLMADVKYSPRLTGPVEEIRSMTMKDFRRLSRDPREATLKIKDKIDLLEDQSFDIKTQGIKAWHDSEINKLYLDILRKSLEGKPISDVIADLDAKGLPFLAKPEFDAVMELNRKLRFG